MDYMSEFWSAPLARGPLSWTQRVPGSKSITNRAYILAALADSPSTLHRPLLSRDTQLMEAALSTMGVTFTHSGQGTEDASVHIVPGPLSGAEVDCGLAGTVMRFLPPLAALASGPVHFDGDAHARTRPMAPLLGALRDLGVEIATHGEGEGLPFTVSSTGVPTGGTVTVDASGSSQFVSGLLLSAARYREGMTVVHRGGPLPSMPHIEMTCEMLRDAGVRVDVAKHGDSWTVHPGPIAGRDWHIEPDLSNATPFLAAAAVAGGTVSIPDWPEHTTQPGDAFRELLTRFGATVRREGTTLHVTGPAEGRLHGLTADMSDIGELTPTVAALCALAESPSRLTGIAHLRGHETDRLAALAREINALGGEVTELDDGLSITPAPLHGGEWHSYADHRMATAGAIIGLRVPGVEVEDIGTTAKTLPGFAGMWEAMIRG